MIRMQNIIIYKLIIAVSSAGYLKYFHEYSARRQLQSG